MPTTVTISPMTRLEGHLQIEVQVDTVSGVQKVTKAKCAGVMFRGFEQILKNRDPRDAVQFSQRICGVCPISHGLASSLALENACNLKPPANGRWIRNLVLGANYLQSHILHFYHLVLLDYVNTDIILTKAPWVPQYTTPDMISGSTAQIFVNNYLKAFEMRRKAHQMGAIFGGRMPIAPVFVPGGTTEVVTADKITAFRTLLTELRSFITNIMLKDANDLGTLFGTYYSIGRGCGNLLTYGGFDLNDAGTSKLFNSGCFTDNTYLAFDPQQILEYVKSSWYSTACGPLHPSSGNTVPSRTKTGAYSWVKAPRYLKKVHEVGPLARMYINGKYNGGISTMDRLIARAMEAQLVANSMDGWLNSLVVGQPVYTPLTIPATASGFGLAEAPRGALGHWLQIQSSKLSRYQVVSPTSWNASPLDDLNQNGPIEQALIGTPVQDTSKPVELLRVVHSFDPCLACSIHLVK